MIEFTVVLRLAVLRTDSHERGQSIPVSRADGWIPDTSSASRRAYSASWSERATRRPSAVGHLPEGAEHLAPARDKEFDTYRVAVFTDPACLLQSSDGVLVVDTRNLWYAQNATSTSRTVAYLKSSSRAARYS